MIKAIIFDLDGTLIQTEVLKATSYARAIHSLTSGQTSEETVLDIFNRFVGLSRQEVVNGLAQYFKFVLERNLNTSNMEEIQNLLITKRLEIYRSILDDTQLLSKHFCPYTLRFFHKVSSDDFNVVLATMSHLSEAKRITSIMEIYDKFDLVLTRDDVEAGKPNPEIYKKAMEELNLSSEECLVMEDSVNGIKAGLNAGMHVFALTNSVTRKSVHDCELLDPKFIIDELEALDSRVYRFIGEQKTVG
nr:HAD family phosphatase [Allomuricauda sp.]